MGYEQKLKERLKLMAKFAKGRVLDIGYAAYPNPYLKGDVYGIDIKQIKRPENYKGMFVGSCYHTRLPDESFDTVIAGQIIEHLHNTGLFLNECNRVLKTGGTLIISTMNPYTLTHIVAEWFHFGFNVKEHINNVSKYSLKTFYNLYGFEVLYLINKGNRYVVIGKKAGKPIKIN